MTTSHYRCDHIGCNARLPYFAVKASRWFIQGKHCLCATHRTRAHRYECECKYPGKTTATLPPMCSTCHMDTRWEHIEAEFTPNGDRVFTLPGSYDVIDKHSELLKDRLQRDLDVRMFPPAPRKVKIPPFFDMFPPIPVRPNATFFGVWKPEDMPPFQRGREVYTPVFKLEDVEPWMRAYTKTTMWPDLGPRYAIHLSLVPRVMAGGVGYLCLVCGHEEDPIETYNALAGCEPRECEKCDEQESRTGRTTT